MNFKHAILSISLGIAVNGIAIASTVVLSEPEVQTIITRAGYSQIQIIEQDGPLLRVLATDQNNQKVTLFVNDQGEILGAADTVELGMVAVSDRIQPPVSKDEVPKILMNAGFHNVHDIDLKNTYWKAEADDIRGDDYEIHIALETGKIIHIEDD